MSTLPDINAVKAHVDTWGTTVTEVAAYLASRAVRDAYTYGGENLIIQSCLVAMGIRKEFPELTATDRIRVANWSVCYDGWLRFYADPESDVDRTGVYLGDAIKELISVTDLDREKPLRKRTYPDLY